MVQFVSEFIGTALLLIVVTGSGIMGKSLAMGNAALALLGNSIATGCGLYVLISLLAPISGAHFNPMVSLLFWRTGALDVRTLYAYLCAQFSGAIVGVWVTHVMFGLPVLQQSANARSGTGIVVSEFISTLILLSVVYLGAQHTKDKPQGSDKMAMLVALTVTGGYWFTSSTFFANPAVTIARSLSDTFVGVAPANVLGFIAAQIVAVFIIILIVRKP